MLPVDLPCDLDDIGSDAVSCDENYSGYGYHVYAVFPEDLAAPLDFEEGKASFGAEAFTFKEGRGAWCFTVKKRSSKIDSEPNEGDTGYKVTGTFVIEKDLEKASAILRKMKNRGNIIFLFERLDGTYSVIYDRFAGTEVKNSFTSGANPSDPKGQTVTVTCDPCRYSDVRWKGVLTLKSAAAA